MFNLGKYYCSFCSYGFNYKCQVCNIQLILVFVYFFGGLQCVGHSFAFVAHKGILRIVFFWIRTQSAALGSGRATNLDHIHHPRKLLENQK
jgi:hypothetical protein